MSAELIRAPEPVGEGALADHPRQLTDGFGRSFPYLRLSLTEACNFRCSYCLPTATRPMAARASCRWTRLPVWCVRSPRWA